MFFKADIKDIKSLNHLMMESEGYWGFDDDYLKAFKESYHLTADFIKKHLCYYLVEDNIIQGFYGVNLNAHELEYLYVMPSRIGTGMGQRLWQHMLSECSRYKINEITFVTSPEAKGFYEKQGAYVIAWIESKVKPGRVIPKLKYVLS